MRSGRKYSAKSPVVEALVAALVMHYVSMLLELIHYWFFNSNGYGVSFFPCHSLATLLHEASKLTLTTLFIVISQGWTITTSSLPNRETLIPIVSATCGFELVGVLVQMAYADSHDAYTARAREGAMGLFLVAIHLTLYYWFLNGVKKCIGDNKLDSKRGVSSAPLRSAVAYGFWRSRCW